MAGGERESRWIWRTKQFLPPPDNTALYQAVVRAFRPLMLQGLMLRGLEFDSFGGDAAILRPALQWKQANCLNPLIKTSILLACNPRWKHLGRGKDRSVLLPFSSGLGEFYSPQRNLHTHMLQQSHSDCVIFMQILICTWKRLVGLISSPAPQ